MGETERTAVASYERAPEPRGVDDEGALAAHGDVVRLLDEHRSSPGAYVGVNAPMEYAGVLLRLARTDASRLSEEIAVRRAILHAAAGAKSRKSVSVWRSLSGGRRLVCCSERAPAPQLGRRPRSRHPRAGADRSHRHALRRRRPALPPSRQRSARYTAVWHGPSALAAEGPSARPLMREAAVRSTTAYASKE
jgi:hypothetical protein